MTSHDTNLQRQLYGIGIFEDEIVLSDFTDGPERRFLVTQDQLMGFFRSEVTFRPFPGLLWMKSDGHNETYLVTLPAAERTVLYRHTRRKRGKKAKKGAADLDALKLRLPAIAVRTVVSAADRRITAIQMWGFTGRTLQRDSVLYELPLPNLTGSSLCLGSTERAVDGDVLGAVERTIFDTPFNHHNHVVGREQIVFHDYVAKHGGRCPLRSLKRLGLGRDILGGAR